MALQSALVFRFFLDFAVRGIYSYHSSSYLSAAILDSLSLAVRNVSVVDASRCQSQIFNLTVARTRLSDDMAFATLCFIRDLSDGPVAAPVPAVSNFRIGVNRKHRRFTRALRRSKRSPDAPQRI